MKKHLSSRKGFTLIELLIAIGLFSVAVSVSVGGFVSALRTQRQVVGLLAANSNVSLTIEQMARELRTGSRFNCLGGNPCTEISFTNADGDTVIYTLVNGAIEKGTNGDFGTVTADNVLVRNLSFELLGSPDFPPRITIGIAVSSPTAGVEGNVTYLQTTVSGRRL